MVGKLFFSVLGAEQLGGKMNACQMSTYFYPATETLTKYPVLLCLSFVIQFLLSTI